MAKSILILDPDTNTQLVLLRLLADAGHVVSSAGDGAGAVAKIEADSPDLVISNVDLPGKSGIQVCQYAKTRQKPIPVILLSSDASSRETGSADALLALPIDTTRVLETVRGLLHADEAEPPAGEAKILVIDDDVGIVNLMTNILTTRGYGVATAGSGREGLDAIERHRPDLVLLDVQMPGLNGFEVLTRIREQRADLPVIMVTAYGSEDVAADALRLGADDYLAKPIRIRNLCFRIQRTLEKAHLRTGQKRLNDQLRRTTIDLTERLETLAQAGEERHQASRRLLGDLRDRLEGHAVPPEALDIIDRLRRIADDEAHPPHPDTRDPV